LSSTLFYIGVYSCDIKFWAPLRDNVISVEYET